MPPAEFEADVERLWDAGEAALRRAPLLRAREAPRRSTARTRSPEHGPIPARAPRQHVGAGAGRTSTTWSSPTRASRRSTSRKTLEAKKIDAKAMVKMGESFFTSLGLRPAARRRFWERSLLHAPARPRGRLPRQRLGRDLVATTCASRCASSRRRTTSSPSTTSSATTSTSRSYYKLPILFQQGANDGFHEGIGDTIALSVTPGVPEGARPPRPTLPDERQGAHQRADEDGAREGGLPAVRPAHRQVALGRLQPEDRRPPSTTRRGGSGGAQVPGRRAARGAHARTTSIPAREVPRRELDAVRALLPRVHLPVPVPPRALQGGGLHGAARRVLDLREQGGGAEARARCSRWARASRGRTRWRR